MHQATVVCSKTHLVKMISLLRTLAVVELNSYIAILDVPKHKKLLCSSGAITEVYQPLILSTPASLSTFHSLDVTDTGTTHHHRPPTSPSPTHKPTSCSLTHRSTLPHRPNHRRPTLPIAHLPLFSNLAHPAATEPPRSNPSPKPQAASYYCRPSLFSLCYDCVFFFFFFF